MLLEKYIPKIEAKLNLQCAVFCTIGSPLESPRWINVAGVREYDDELGIHYLRFESTQTSAIHFSIEISELDARTFSCSHKELWAEMKRIRTKFLLENYPTIRVY